VIQRHEDAGFVATGWAFRLSAGLILLSCGFALGIGVNSGAVLVPALAVFMAILSVFALMALLMAIRRQNFMTNEIGRIAETDGTTNTLTRAAFERRVMRHVSEGATGALLVIAFEDFGLVNKWLGLDGADAALQIALQFISEMTGDQGFAGRIAGAEFAVFLPHAGFQAANDLGRQIVTGLAAYAWPEEMAGIYLTANVGGVAFSHPAPFQKIYDAASMELARVKSETWPDAAKSAVKTA
jgi:GGDEF domain-containing protein